MYVIWVIDMMEQNTIMIPSIWADRPGQTV